MREKRASEREGVEGAGSDDDDGADETGSVSVEDRVRVADTEGSWSEDVFVDASLLFPLRSRGENDIGDGCGPRERTAA